MKFKPVLKHHDLKKNGYKVVRKLHKLENKKNVRSSGKMDGICFYVLSCRHLAELIEVEYADHTFAAKFTPLNRCIQKAARSMDSPVVQITMGGRSDAEYCDYDKASGDASQRHGRRVPEPVKRSCL